MASRHAGDPAPLDPDEVDTASSAAARPIATSPYSAIFSSRKSGLTLRNFSFSRRSSAATGYSSEEGWGPTGLNLLHSPPDPLLDLVFVHGLRGGSIKMWCKNNDPQLYWPKAWLPKDPDLQNVGIHSFGYNSDWGESKETELDLHDFGRSLLAELTTSPELRKGDKTPIILIGHSMGGLVMKKAYILARQDDRYHEFANRIQCMFFLASPHRGSDSAKLLNSVLRVSPFLNPKQ
ncbi:Alpha/Beta hydrolase fold [Rhypophila sp. PSN 637]